MSENINFKDFQKLDIRIGTVTEAVVPEWSHWVIKLTVDFGEEVGKRTIFAGMLGFKKPEEFVDNQYPFLINLEPKKIGPEGDMSEGMMMAADNKLVKPVIVDGEETFDEPILLSPEKSVPSGTKVR